MLGQICFGPTGSQYCIHCVDVLGSEALDKIMSDPSLKDIRGQLFNDVLTKHDFSILSNDGGDAGTLSNQGDDTTTNRDDDAGAPGNQDDATNRDEEDNASTKKSWSDLKKYRRISQTSVDQRSKGLHYFYGQIERQNRGARLVYYTHGFGSAPGALLEQECLNFASKSTFNDGRISYCKPLNDMSLEQWTTELREFVGTMRLIPDSSRYLEKDDLCGDDVVDSTLRAVASRLTGPLLANWKCSRRILKSLAADLVQIADGERQEFPWRDTDTPPVDDLPSFDKFLADNEKLLRDLNDPDPKKRAKTRDIARRSNYALYCFAYGKTSHGHYGPPSSISASQAKCTQKRKELADHGTECWFRALIRRDAFLNELPDEYKDNPFTMPIDLRKKLMCAYMTSRGVFRPGYTPPFFAPEGSFSLKRSQEDVQDWKLRWTEELKKNGNLEMLREQLAEFEAKVRYACLPSLFTKKAQSNKGSETPCIA